MIALGDYMDARCHACIGGTNVRTDIKTLKEEGTHIVVGTPGRVFDMISRNALRESSPCFIGATRSILIFLDFHSTKQGQSLSDSLSHGLD